MSEELIGRSSDLKKLRDLGFEIEIRGAFLLVHGVPYVNSACEIRRGTLVSELTLAGDRTAKPENHVIHFIGEQPCNKDGTEITSITHQASSQSLTPEITVNRSFSNKPADGYLDYFEKINRYVELISAPAQALDPTITARKFKSIPSDDQNSAFNYLDTNSSRAEIDSVVEILKTQKVAIVGVGGTGGYILDMVSKTPVAAIHIFDEDDFLQHNAFRAPGAASLDELASKPKKVDYLNSIYSRMHRNIKAHPYFITAENYQELEGFDMVFLSMDDGAEKKAIIRGLENLKITFIDVGIGVEVVEQSLLATVRTTTGQPGALDHIWEKKAISFADPDGDDIYSKNIQIAELNALNAALAVIKWKKLLGYYLDIIKDRQSIYTSSDNLLFNDNDET
jgi:ThiF family